MNVIHRTAVVSVTVIVSEADPQRVLPESLSLTGKPILANASTDVNGPATAKPKAKPLVIQHAAAVLTGQPDFLERIAPCFTSENASIKKLGEKWTLESSEFLGCTTEQQLFSVADDLVSRVHRILALYVSATPSLSAKYVSWTDAEGQRWRVIRGSISTDIVSSKGLADLRKIRGKQPLGSTVFQTMSRDPAVKEALALHGEGELGWSQIYDIIEFLGGVRGIVKAKFANEARTHIIRRTANHHRHLARLSGL